MSYEELVRYQRTKHWAAIFDRDVSLHYAFDGAKHPRGNPKNKGQFASKGSAGGKKEAAPAKKKVAKEEAKPKKSAAKSPAVKATAAVKSPAAKKPAAKKAGGKPIEKSREQSPPDFTGAANIGKESSILHQVVNAIDKAPDDPAQVQKQAEGVMAKVEAAIKEGKLGGTIPPAAKKIVDEHTESLMDKIGGKASAAAKRTMQVIGGLGLIGVGVAMGGLGVAVHITNPILSILTGMGGSLIGSGLKVGSAGMNMVAGRASDDYDYARSGDVLRYEAGDDDGELSMDEIKELAKEYYGGILADLQKVLKSDADGSYYDQIVAKRKAAPV